MSLASAQLLAQVEVEIRQHCAIKDGQLVMPMSRVCKLFRGGGLSHLGLSPARFRAFARARGLEVSSTAVLTAALPMFMAEAGTTVVDPSAWRRLEEQLQAELLASSLSSSQTSSDRSGGAESLPPESVDHSSVVDLVSESDAEAVPAAVLVAPAADSADNYDDLTREECIATLRSRDKALRAKHNALNKSLSARRGAFQKLRRSTKRIKSLQLALKQAKQRQSFDIEKRGTRRLTPRGVLCVAIRRNLSNVSARTFGTAVLEDIGKDTVIRAELQTGSALTAWSRSFHASSEAAINSADWGIAVHACRSDATNSAIWHNAKLFSSDVDSVYVCSDDMSNDKLPDDVNRHHAWGELQRVGDSSTA